MPERKSAEDRQAERRFNKQNEQTRRDARRPIPSGVPHTTPQPPATPVDRRK